MKRLRAILLTCAATIFIAPVAHAELIVECAKRSAGGERGDCQLIDFVKQFVILQQWALGFVVILAVMMFVWAGFKFVTAAGRGSWVDDGKKIIGGTITGLIVSFSAYVIVNFAVFSLTGTSVKGRDFWAGPIAVVFPTQTTELKRPWSGLQSGDERKTCRGSNNDTWDKSCEAASTSNPLQIYCSDPGDTNTGTIHDWQAKLSQHSCNCFNVNGQQADGTQKPDGCYGPDTTRCVQIFQVANRIPPSGMIDGPTAAALDNTSSQDCDPAFVNPIISQLPAINNSGAGKLSATETGCCVVGSANQADVCLNNITRKTCGAISAYSDSPFEADKDCSIGRFADVCGYCRNPLPTITSGNPVGIPNLCYQYVSEKWCKDNGMPAYIFTPGPSAGVYQCKNALLLKPEPN